MEALVDITAVEVIGQYRLRLSFKDGAGGDVDFSEPLCGPRSSVLRIRCSSRA
jgi:hypothetical protein